MWFKRMIWLPPLSSRDLKLLGLFAFGLCSVGVLFVLLTL